MMPGIWEAFTRTHCLSRTLPLNLPKLAHNRPKSSCGKMGRRLIKGKPWGGYGSPHPIKGSTWNGLHCIDRLKGSIRLMMPSTWEAYKRTHSLSRNVPLSLTKLAQNRPVVEY